MNNVDLGLEIYLLPTYFMDADHPDIISYVNGVLGNETDPKQKAIKLYYAVRDDFRYNPYNIDLHHKELKASSLLNRPSKSGYCVEKACLLSACFRAAGIPSRLCFFDVRNHIGVERFTETLKTDVLVFHACCDVYLDGLWVKATPAFNKELCDKLGVQPLEFDGVQDSIFQQFDKKGQQFMEYLHDYGTFHDVPHDMFVRMLRHHYPHFFEKSEDKAMTRK
jgi:transglutaminase-like putative cysteine protease